MGDLARLDESVKAARRNLSPDDWDYLIAGADTGAAIVLNPQALDSLAGLMRVLELLETEMEIVIGLLGLTSLDKLSEDFLEPALPVTFPGVLRAFSCLKLPPQEY